MPTGTSAGTLQIDETTAKAADNLREELYITIAPELARDYSYLLTDTFYIDVFTELLKMSETSFSKREFLRAKEHLSAGERIQELINMLSKDILQSDLSHIQGNQITSGNKKHITNFLQILEALYLHLTQGGARFEELDQTRSNLIDREINHNQSFEEEEQINKHTQGSYKHGNVAEGGNGKGASAKQTQSAANNPDHAELFDKMVNDGQLPAGAETGKGVPTHLEDPVNYKNMELQPNYVFEQGKKTKKRGQKKRAMRPQSAAHHTGQVVYSYPTKEQIVDTIERNIYGPNTLKANKSVKLAKNLGNNQQLVKEYDRLVRQGDAVYFDDLMRQQAGPGLLDPNIASIRQYVDGKRKDDEVQDAVMRQREQYLRQLQDMTSLAQRKLREKQMRSSKAQEANLRAKHKALEIYQSNVQNELNYEEKAVQLKKRDQEIRNRQMFDMQKWAAIEERKKYMEAKQKRKEQTKNVISSVEQFYKDKISQLKERLSEERANRKEAEYAQRKLLTQLEKELKLDNRRQMAEMIDKWKGEGQKFELMTDHDSKLAEQLSRQFRKYNLA